MKTTLFHIALLILISNNIFSQGKLVSGYITDKTTNNPIANVEVYKKNNSLFFIIHGAGKKLPQLLCNQKLLLLFLQIHIVLILFYLLLILTAFYWVIKIVCWLKKPLLNQYLGALV